MLLVLAIIAALAVAAFVIYPRVQAGRSATYEAQVLSSAQASVKALFTNNDYKALAPTVARQGKFFPDNMNGTAAGTLINQFDGAVTLYGAAVDTSDGTVTVDAAAGTTVRRHFAITYAGVPTEVCIKLAGSAVQNFNGVFIGGTAAANMVKNPATGAITEANIVTGCSSASNVDMTFVSN